MIEKLSDLLATAENEDRSFKPLEPATDKQPDGIYVEANGAARQRGREVRVALGQLSDPDANPDAKIAEPIALLACTPVRTLEG